MNSYSQYYIENIRHHAILSSTDCDITMMLMLLKWTMECTCVVCISKSNLHSFSIKNRMKSPHECISHNSSFSPSRLNTKAVNWTIGHFIFNEVK
mmetsp:Transcript_10472/g.13104  ORF Transcript_10472/g.13104 Transcript_10472/m.13104 type:complete len:95 (-) Transcript_10472:445-729(-)